MIRALYERLTGRPWTTGRRLSTDEAVLSRYGQPPAIRYREQLAAYTDTELVERGPEILAELREQEAAVNRLLAAAERSHATTGTVR